MWFTKQAAFLLQPAHGPCIKATSTHKQCLCSTSKRKREKKNEIEFVPNYGIICNKTLSDCYVSSISFRFDCDWVIFLLYFFSSFFFVLSSHLCVSRNVPKCWNTGSKWLTIDLYKVIGQSETISIRVRTSGAQEKKLLQIYYTRRTARTRLLSARSMRTNRFSLTKMP